MRAFWPIGGLNHSRPGEGDLLEGEPPEVAAAERDEHHRYRRFAFPRHHQIAVAVGAFYYLAALFIFRDIIIGLPAIMRGEVVVAGDELVPFFNPTSQLIDQAKGEYSELTNGYEFRVRYSFLTTWLRYYKVLPYAVLFILPTIVWAAYGTTSWFLSRVFTSLTPVTVYLSTIFPTSLIYLIMIYAKVTHFYTLVLGLAMMTVSAYIMMYALLFRETRWLRLVVISCLVTLLNPAVHYLILFALFLSISVATLILGEFARWIRHGGVVRVITQLRPRHLGKYVTRPNRIHIVATARSSLNSTTGRSITAMVTLVSVAIIPYGLFVKFVALRGIPNISETVPGDYYFIRDASVSLVHILSWDLAGIMDKIQFGDYLSKTPRVPNMIYSVLTFVPLLVGRVRRALFTTRAHRQLLGVIYVNVNFAIWATVGYGDPEWFPTFHRSLAATTRALYSTETPIGDLTLEIAATIVQVLRFPHRFQLILFMLGPAVLSLPVALTIQKLTGHQPFGQQCKRAVAIGMVFLVPFFANTPYRSTYSSGNFGHFFTPYPVEELKELKTALRSLPQGKTVVLPPTETAKLVVTTDNVTHKFIDKFYIYYLDEPSFYYGLTGDKDNKFEFFLLLRGLYYQQDWWVNIARDIELDYIVLNKQIQSNDGIGAEYLPELEAYLRVQLEAVPDQVEAVFENDSFVLYRFIDRAPADREVLLFDTSWKGYLDAVFTRLSLSSCYDFDYISSYTGAPDDGTLVNVLASDNRSAAIDLWAIDNQERYFPPSQKTFAFNSDIVASSYYLSPMFRLFLFFSDTKWNRNEMITPGIFGTLRGSFIGVPRPTRFTVPMTVDEPDRYRILLRAATTANYLDVRAESLSFEKSVEWRADPEALQLFDSEIVYDRDRVATDISSTPLGDLENQIPGELVPINLRYVYLDLGVVEVPAGAHTLIFDKRDSNPMLVEGVLLIPDETYESLHSPEDVPVELSERATVRLGGASPIRSVESISDLRCNQVTPVREGLSDGINTASGEAKEDLTSEEVLELLGVDDLAPPQPGGLGNRALQIVGLLLILSGGALVVRWRARLESDPDHE